VSPISSFRRILLPLTLCLTGVAFAGSAVNIAVGEFPTGVAVNPKTNTIYTANSGYASNSVSVIDGYTNTVVAAIPVGSSPCSVDVNLNTNMVYVANDIEGSVSVIDGSTNTVVATIGGMDGPQALAVNSRTNLIYVVNYGSGQISEIDGRTNTVIANLTFDTEPAQGIAINTASNLVYVATGATIYVLNGETDTITASFNVASLGIGQSIAYDATSNRIFAVGLSESASSVVFVLDATTGTLLGTITGGPLPFQSAFGVAVLVPGSSVVISDYSRSLIYEASETTFQTLRSVKATETPEIIAVNRNTGIFYVTEYNPWTVTAYSL
jgi:YVTN family beta-propeller protein